MAVEALAPARAVRRPRRWLVSRQALFSLFLAGLAMLGGIYTLSARDTQPVLVAARELPAGTVLTAGDLTIAWVRLSPDLYPATVPESELDSLIGRALAEPVHAGEILNRRELGDPGPRLAPGQVVMTVSPDPEKGRLGGIEEGDWVQVFVTLPPDDAGRRETRLVLARAQVYEIGKAPDVDAAAWEDPEGSADEQTGRVEWLSLAVTQEEAAALANAKWSGDLDIALLPRGVRIGRP